MTATAVLPKTMKAAVLLEQRKPLDIWEVSLPAELGIGQVMVKLSFSGICGSQLGEIDGAKGPDRFLPHLLGHEGSGHVVAVGPGVETVKCDDAVVLHWRPSSGLQGKPPVYNCGDQKVNAGWVTTFNDYAVVSENRVTAIPSGSDMRVAALLGCAVTTGYGVIVRDAKLSIGESVVIYGAGGVGLNIVQAAALVSGWPIIAVDMHDSRLELAREFGATHLINASREDAKARIAEIMSGRELDCFIDNTGQPDIIEYGYSQVSARGRVILVGVPKAGSNISIHSLPLHFGKQIRGSQGGGAEPDEDIPRYMELHERGRVRLRELVTREVALDGINEAIAGMRDGSIAGRCLVAFD